LSDISRSGKLDQSVQSRTRNRLRVILQWFARQSAFECRCLGHAHAVTGAKDIGSRYVTIRLQSRKELDRLAGVTSWINHATYIRQILPDLKLRNSPDPRKTAVEQVSPSFLTRGARLLVFRCAEDTDFQSSVPIAIYAMPGIHPRNASQMNTKAAKMVLPSRICCLETPAACRNLVALWVLLRIADFNLKV
jgi:hypothetical protein